MSKTTFLHSNDIHGRVDGLARIGTLVAEARAAQGDRPLFYFDIGDSEEYANRLSSLTKGAAMHRLLEAASCDGTVVGNAIMSRYGPKAVTAETEVTTYPHLVANIHTTDGRPIPGTQPTAMLPAGDLRLGLIGVTSDMDNYGLFFDLQQAETLPLVRALAAGLRDEGADAVILLSHMGLEADRELAAGLQGEVPLILGAHSHDLLPQGEWVGDVLIVQAGEYAEHLGRVELEWRGNELRASEAGVIEVTENIQPSVAVLDMIGRVEAELQEYLGEVICEIAEPLDFDTSRECALGNLVADALRERAGADVAIAIPGPKFITGVAAGPLRRETLWSACPSTGNPGVVSMSGEQLAELVRRGLDPEFAADKHPALRGAARGFVHLSGATVRDGQLLITGRPLDPTANYRVAGCDIEFEPWWGYTDETWQLRPEYEVDVILREALYEYLTGQGSVLVEMGRVG